MHNKTSVITGILLFLAAAAFPVWNNIISPTNKSMATNTTTAAQNLGVQEEGAEGGCIEDTDFMRQKHMLLLHTWRDDVVRNNNRVYTNAHGKTFEKSLVNTCLGCHEDQGQNKSENFFCERCHKSAGVRIDCFQCHTSAEAVKMGGAQ